MRHAGKSNKKVRVESFFILDTHTKIYDYLLQSWLSILISQVCEYVYIYTPVE